MEAPRDKVSNSEDAKNVLSVLATENGIDNNIIGNNIDKVCPIGVQPTGATSKQLHIVKFKSNSFKEKSIHGLKRTKET